MTQKPNWDVLQWLRTENLYGAMINSDPLLGKQSEVHLILPDEGTSEVKFLHMLTMHME